MSQLSSRRITKTIKRHNARRAINRIAGELEQLIAYAPAGTAETEAIAHRKSIEAVNFILEHLYGVPKS